MNGPNAAPKPSQVEYVPITAARVASKLMSMVVASVYIGMVSRSERPERSYCE